MILIFDPARPKAAKVQDDDAARMAADVALGPIKGEAFDRLVDKLYLVGYHRPSFLHAINVIVNDELAKLDAKGGVQ